MKPRFLGLVSLLLSYPVQAQEDASVDANFEVSSSAEDIEFEFDNAMFNSNTNDSIEVNDAEKSFWQSLSKRSRVTLRHETSYRTQETKEIVNNRLSAQLEYSQFFLNNFYVRLDTKANVFFENDHRAKAEKENVLLEQVTREAFLQGSLGNTSFQLGIQNLIWGESDGGALTDVISPRNASELFFIPLEESRIGQFMFRVEHFSDNGDFSFFYTPDAEFDELPDPGTAYDVFSLPMNIEVEKEKDSDLYEFGGRWIKTFGKSDISLMAANLIENNRHFAFKEFSSNGNIILEEQTQRFSMVGVTFNYVRDSLLWRGEFAYKSSLVFSDSNFNPQEKKVYDTSLSLQYSLPGNDSISMEWVNRHINDWNNTLQGVEKDNSSIILNWQSSYFNEELSINVLSIYSFPYTSFQHSVRTTYDWIDNWSINFDFHIVDVQDSRSALSPYENEHQIVFKIQYQF